MMHGADWCCIEIPVVFSRLKQWRIRSLPGANTESATANPILLFIPRFIVAFTLGLTSFRDKVVGASHVIQKIFIPAFTYDRVMVDIPSKNLCLGPAEPLLQSDTVRHNCPKTPSPLRIEQPPGVNFES